MFERFTERARKVIVLAQEEARDFRHNYIGTEHLLLGLLKEREGVAARALKAMNVSLGSVREQVESTVGFGKDEPGGMSREEPGGVLRRLRERIAGSRIGGHGDEGTTHQAPFTPRSKKVLELASRETLQLGHDYIGTEHILLGLLRESEGVSARAFRNMRVKPGDVRREVLRRLGESPEPDSLDMVEAKMEAGNDNVFRARVSGIEVKANLELNEPQRKSVNSCALELDYSYLVLEERASRMDHEVLIESATEALIEDEHQSLEAGVASVGGRILNEFPNIIKLTVSISVPEFSPVSVSATVGW